MIINTETIDIEKVAIALLKRGGMDWIDQPTDALWASVADPADRAAKESWRAGLIAGKQREVKSLLDMIAEAAQ